LDQINNYFANEVDFLPAGRLASSLFAIWIGANDYLDAGNPFDPSLQQNVTDSIVNGIARLYALGARNILVLNLPALAQSPVFSGAPQAEINAIDNLSSQHDILLWTKLNAWNAAQGNEDVHLFLFNASQAAVYILRNAESFNVNVTDRGCVDFSTPIPTICTDPQFYVFWDSQHLTTYVYQEFTGLLLDFFEALQPEASRSGPGKKVMPDVHTFSKAAIFGGIGLGIVVVSVGVALLLNNKRSSERSPLLI